MPSIPIEASPLVSVTRESRQKKRPSLLQASVLDPTFSAPPTKPVHAPICNQTKRPFKTGFAFPFHCNLSGSLPPTAELIPGRRLASPLPAKSLPKQYAQPNSWDTQKSKQSNTTRFSIRTHSVWYLLKGTNTLSIRQQIVQLYDAHT